MANGLQEIKKPTLLIGEGKEEVEFFSTIFEHLKLDDRADVWPCNGKDGLPALLKNLRLVPGWNQLLNLGVIRDADADSSAAFQSVCGSLKASGFNAPSENAGFSGSKPRVGIPILPPGKNRGMLEDVCLEALSGDPAQECVEGFFECVKNKGVPLPREISKAKVRAWLTTRERPDLLLGQAARKKYWNWSHKAFEPILRFVRELVEG